MARAKSNFAAGPMGDGESISVRKIENGYVVSRSCYDPKKGYQSSESFSAQKPKIEVAGGSAPKRQAAPSALGKAIKAVR